MPALHARSHEYLHFSDERHAINRTANRIAHMRAVERFLLRQLGGRDAGDPRG